MKFKIKLLDFIRQIFKDLDILNYKQICEKVKINEEILIDAGKDYKHRVRQHLFHLKKHGEIIRISRGVYKRTNILKSKYIKTKYL